MGILALRADERVANVTFTADSLSVSLKDGEPSRFHLPGTRSSFTPRESSATIGKSPVWDTESTGPIWTKTSAWKGYSAALRRLNVPPKFNFASGKMVGLP